jgi:hypothetical protein
LAFQNWRVEITKFVGYYGNELPVNVEMTSAQKQKIDQQILQGHKELNNTFKMIVKDLEEIVSPILHLRRPLAQFVKHQLATRANIKPAMQSLLLLIDPLYHDLPWEALEFFESAFGNNIARDFSVHLFDHRVSTFQSNSSAVNLIQSGMMKYCVDPYGDDKGSVLLATFERDGLTKSFQTLMSSGQISGGSRWQALASETASNENKSNVDGKMIPCQQDWINMTRSINKTKPCSVDILMPSKLSSILPPTDIAVMNMEQLAFYCIVDLGDNGML